MQCLVRLVRAMLGPDSVADHKVECGTSLVILGVLVIPSADGYVCKVDEKKAAKCLAVIRKALSSGVLFPGGFLFSF